MAQSSLDSFCLALIRSKLLSQEQLAEVRRESGPRVSVQPLVDELIRAGHLTRWQADEALHGRQDFCVGKYKLVDRLGQGTLGSLFQAEHLLLGRTVVLRVLPPTALRGKAEIEAFEAQCKQASKIRHASLPAVLHWGESAARARYVVFEYVRGSTVAELLEKNQKLPVSWTCESIRQLADGMQQASEQNLLHGGIDPRRVFIDGEPRVPPMARLIDWSMGRVRTLVESRKTADVIDDGFDPYRAPERQAGRPVTVESDIFSFGCLMFEMITGVAPFEQPLTGDDRRPLERAAQLLSEVDLPPGLHSAWARMTALDPEDRYQTFRDVAATMALFARQSAANPAYYGFNCAPDSSLTSWGFDLPPEVRVPSRQTDFPVVEVPQDEDTRRRMLELLLSGWCQHVQRGILCRISPSSMLEAWLIPPELLPRPSTPASVTRARLVVVEGSATEKEIEIRPPVTVGRISSADVVINHGLVSRKHCDIFSREGQLWIRDHDSANGSFIDGQRVQEAPLPSGSKLAVGPVTFGVVYGPREAADRKALSVPPAAAAKQRSSKRGSVLTDGSEVSPQTEHTVVRPGDGPPQQETINISLSPRNKPAG